MRAWRHLLTQERKLCYVLFSGDAIFLWLGKSLERADTHYNTTSEGAIKFNKSSAGLCKKKKQSYWMYRMEYPAINDARQDCPTIKNNQQCPQTKSKNAK